jgi:light-regulated signal transduction histidine kinase (bacteriophytochrome)
MMVKPFESLVTAKNVTLSNCDREQIHIPGAIQPHGAMLVLAEPSLAILQASANCADFLGYAADVLVGKSMADTIGREVEDRLREQRGRSQFDNGPCHLMRGRFAARDCNVFGHRSGGVILIEFELIPSELASPALDLFSETRDAITHLQTTTTLYDFFAHAVEQVRRITGFDVVMAYQFQDDGSGHVMAESKLPHIQSYLGMHFPPSDIPAPARRLFALSWLRHLPDVDYQAVPVFPAQAEGQDPIDMSRSLLRSVSVMYTDYLKNMGVRATIVMPLLKDGALWGLIAASHYGAPKHVPFEVRTATEFLAHMISLLLSSKEKTEGLEVQLRMTATLNELAKNLRSAPNLIETLARDKGPNLLSLFPAQGAAIFTSGDKGVATLGLTPDAVQLRELVNWLDSQNRSFISTDRLSFLFPPAAAYADCASGLLAVRLSPHSRDYLLWFRPELVRIVKWAGDPNKPADIDESSGELRLTPRKSFAVWQEAAHGRSQPWSDVEKQCAETLGQTAAEFIPTVTGPARPVDQDRVDGSATLALDAQGQAHDALAEESKAAKGEFADIERVQLETVLKLTRRMDDLIELLAVDRRDGRH